MKLLLIAAVAMAINQETSLGQFKQFFQSIQKENFLHDFTKKRQFITYLESSAACKAFGCSLILKHRFHLCHFDDSVIFALVHFLWINQNFEILSEKCSGVSARALSILLFQRRILQDEKFCCCKRLCYKEPFNSLSGQSFRDAVLCVEISQCDISNICSRWIIEMMQQSGIPLELIYPAFYVYHPSLPRKFQFYLDFPIIKRAVWRSERMRREKVSVPYEEIELSARLHRVYQLQSEEILNQTPGGEVSNLLALLKWWFVDLRPYSVERAVGMILDMFIDVEISEIADRLEMMSWEDTDSPVEQVIKNALQILTLLRENLLKRDPSRLKEVSATLDHRIALLEGKVTRLALVHKKADKSNDGTQCQIY